ncbi:aminopeptidase P family protein [Pedobacter frigidisoli]|uniref:Xaa-Pro aminopeptidase n=1 Tax=Pedobacter frigidisoli TaxID=2530455 RepID=A0A4V6N679_9SPHI|nr:aminopeptidase P family protein [Pedobacter frigidisoli]TCD10521.1 aminopeptidase P family protein [Pedobacter frigidisoli]
MFDKQVYIQRRAALKSQLNSGILLFLGNEDSPMNYKDNTYHFRQDSTFLYYFGISEPNLAAVIDLDEDEIMLFGNEMGIDDIVWMGRQKTLQEKSEDSGLKNVQPAEKLAFYLSQYQQKNRAIHFLPPYRSENKIKLSAWLNLKIDQLKSAASIPFIKAVVAQRSIKSIEEITELDKAASLSADMHLMIMQQAKPGMYERELAAKIQEAALSSGGNLAYPAILTVRGEILHNHNHGNLLKDGQMVLNDSGVETEMGYAGDLTRTFPVGKKFSAEQKDVYDIVLQAYTNAKNLLAPGVRYLDVHLTSCKTLAQGLKDIGLMKGNVDDAVAAGAHAMFFQCGTGHMMGLDVHDMEDLGEQYVGYTEELIKNTTQFGLKSLRLGKELEAGYVLTVEPGVYIIPELIDPWKATYEFAEFINYDKLEQFRYFTGIRVEDDFLVTENGGRMLGKHLALTTTEIEDIRSQA